MIASLRHQPITVKMECVRSSIDGQHTTKGRSMPDVGALVWKLVQAALTSTIEYRIP